MRLRADFPVTTEELDIRVNVPSAATLPFIQLLTSPGLYWLLAEAPISKLLIFFVIDTEVFASCATDVGGLSKPDGSFVTHILSKAIG